MIDYPCAKINLGLNVVSKREDGYHNLETVFYPVPLYDRIEIKEADGGTADGEQCHLDVDGIKIEGNVRDNLVVKAYNMLKERFADLPPVNIRLTKNIPSQAGMGGGSADCAYTITALNRMFNLGMTDDDMRQTTARLGADCAFFINPVPSFATGIGEQLSPVSVDLRRYVLGIVKPPLMISTKEAFANVTPHLSEKSCRDIVAQPIESWKDELTNDFELSVISRHSEIATIKQTLYGMGAVYAAMSGSGSALFGIFRREPRGFSEAFKDCFTTLL